MHDVLGPDDEVDLAVDGRCGGHMPLEHGPGGAHVGPGVLWPTTLDDRHVDGVERLDAEGAEHAAHDKRNDHADGDHGVASTLNELPDRKAGPGHHDGEAGRAEGASGDPERGRHADHGVGRDGGAAEGVVPADEFGQDERCGEGERPDGETVRWGRDADDAGAEREDRHRNRPAGGGEVDHPEGGGECPRQSDDERDREAPPAFLSGDEFEPERDADERQWPPAPRREAGGDEQTGRDGEEAGAGAHGIRGARRAPVGSSRLECRSAVRRSVESGTGVRIAHASAIPTDNRSLRRAAPVGRSDPLAADRPGLGAAFAPQGTGYRVLPPGIDVDRIQVDEPREVPLGDTVPGGLVELVGASVRA